MPNLLGIGTSALLSMQQALATTGHNIANVGTEGYHRQSVEFSTLPSHLYQGHYIGTGTQISSIDRIQDQFVEREIRNFNSAESQSSVYYGLSSRIDQLLSDSGSGLTASMQDFFSAVQNVANSPSALPEREILLGEAESLALRQQNLYQSLSSLGQEVNSRLQVTVNEINSLASSISDLNNVIANNVTTGQGANDLLDQRDRLIETLSTKVGVSTLEQSDGSINVLIGNGYGLVVGSEAGSLKTVTNEYDASRLDVAISGDNRIANGLLSGGELQGLLDFRTRALDPATSSLSLMSVGLAETMNAQHGLGVDLNGNAGEALFTLAPITTLGSIDNTGTATPQTQVSDVSQMQSSAYLVSFDTGVWQLTRQSDGVSVTGAGPLSLDGLTVDVSAGVPANGDSFLIRPATSAAAGFGTTGLEPRAIAAAAPLVANTAVANTGSLELSDLAVTDTASLPLSGPVTLSFDPDAMGPGIPGFNVTGAITTSVAYDPGTDAAGININLGPPGLNFTLSGVPVPGDNLTLENTGTSSGDNRNALSLAGLQFSNTMAGGSASYGDLYSGMVGRSAVGTEQAANAMEVESSLLQQAQQYRNSVSGVSLDEEAANLLRFQQQYQAAAQLISVADTIFQTLLGATRR